MNIMIQRSLALLFVLWTPQFAQKNGRAQTQGGLVVIGDTIQLQSNTLKESRTLLIAKPVGYDSGTDRYPVLYLLDVSCTSATRLQSSISSLGTTASQRC